MLLPPGHAPPSSLAFGGSHCPQDRGHAPCPAFIASMSKLRLTFPAISPTTPLAAPFVLTSSPHFPKHTLTHPLSVSCRQVCSGLTSYLPCPHVFAVLSMSYPCSQDQLKCYLHLQLPPLTIHSADVYKVPTMCQALFWVLKHSGDKNHRIPVLMELTFQWEKTSKQGNKILVREKYYTEN